MILSWLIAFCQIKRKKNRSPGGFGLEMTESCITYGDSEATSSNAELRSSPFKKIASAMSGNLGTTSNNEVHELLECPVCMNLMYPPIHQVTRQIHTFGFLSLLEDFG